MESGETFSRKEGDDISGDSDAEDNNEESQSQSQVDLMIRDLYEKVSDGSLSVYQRWLKCIETEIH